MLINAGDEDEMVSKFCCDSITIAQFSNFCFFARLFCPGMTGFLS